MEFIIMIGVSIKLLMLDATGDVLVMGSLLNEPSSISFE